MAPEQEDRFAEPLGPERGDLAHPAGTLDETDQSCHGLVSLLDGGPPQVRHGGPARNTEPPMHLGHHCTPAMEHRGLGCIAGGALCPVAIEPLQVEQPRPESEQPPLDGACSDAGASGSAGHGRAFGECFREGLHDHLDPGDLARQRIAGQYPLAMSAPSATCEGHAQRHERVGCLEPASDPTTSKLEITPRTARAATTGEETIASTVDDRRVAAMLNVEYEHHVLMTAPG
jgi:hypothetical protein